MINFIVVDDFKEITETVKEIITKIMMKNKLEYKIHIFNDYNKDFINIMEKPLLNKIYFLDIETSSASGIDIARKIRKIDLESVLIFITAHEELGTTIIKDQLMALTFICKFDDFENKIKESINKSLNFIGKKKVVKINDRGSIYIISIDDIFYITHDNIERKSIIKTKNGIYKLNKSLIELKEIIGESLVQTHRSCLVNEEKIIKFNKKKKIITLENGEQINLVSDNYKMENKK